MRSTLLAVAAVLSLGFRRWPSRQAAVRFPVHHSTAKPADPNFARAKAMIEAKDYKGALPLLQQVVAKDPRNADAYNLMGYATRKPGDPERLAAILPARARHRSPASRRARIYRRGLSDAQPAGRRPAASGPARFALRFRLHRVPQLKAAIANYNVGKRPTN